MATIEKRKNQTGKITYRAKVRLKGFPTQSATFNRKTDADRWIKSTESAIREGRHFKTSEAKKRTLDEIIDRYKKEILPRKPKAVKQRTMQLSWWSKEIGCYSLADVTASIISENRSKLLSEEIAPNKTRSSSTVNRYMAALSHVLSIANREWEWISENPCSKLSKLSEPRGRVRFLSDDERSRLLIACKQSKSRHLYVIVVLALSTGMRLGEILSLSWEQVDLKTCKIILHDTKNNERRAIPLKGHAYDVVEDWSRIQRIDTKMLFPNKRDPHRHIDIRSPWYTALQKAEIEDFHFHDLRHSAASYLAMNGATLAEIAEVLGHKTLQMVKRYAHLSEAHTSSVVASMNEKIFGNAG